MDNTITLNNKKQIPIIGLGTWRSDKEKITQAVEYAVVKTGYRHIDCASIYENEKEIGKAFLRMFSAKKAKREEIFVTSKLWNTDHHPRNVEKACRQTLKDLQLEYLDLYLIHWGIAFANDKDLEPVSIQETWRAMEQLVEKGLVRSIGVSNFTTPMIVDLLSYAKIKPVVNQIEIHPYNTQEELINYCHKQQIQVTAYSPLGSLGDSREKPLTNKIVTDIAKTHQKTPAQVLIKWSLQKGLVVIPKSLNADRISENIDVFDFELSDKEMKQISQLNRNHRFVDPSEWWGIPYFN